MLHWFEIWMGSRYVRARSSNRFVSLISAISMLGIDERRVPWLEQAFGFQIMPGDVYYVTDIPSEIELFDVAAIGIAAFVLTSLATLYPARRAALVNPSMALRYE